MERLVVRCLFLSKNLMVSPCVKTRKDLMNVERCCSLAKRISKSSRLFIREVMSFWIFLISMSLSSARDWYRGSPISSLLQVSLNLNLADEEM